jgi:hypothetical protein
MNSAAQLQPKVAVKRRGPVLSSPFKGLRSRMSKRRSRSAPPALRRPMIEQHFRVDASDKKVVVLPGVPRHGDDSMRDAHDFFNLIILIPILALNIMNWNWDILLNLTNAKNKHRQNSFQDAWTGEWFDLFFMATMCYFFADLAWILIIPSCVKSPSTIIQHHIVTMLYILIPYFQPEVRWCMGVCMSVEINTWFLIARRVFNKEGFSPWIIDLSFISFRVKIISICFYMTWIGIRCILYPILWLWLWKRWWANSLQMGTKFNLDLIAPVLHSSFCILNFKWTYDLTMSKIRYWRRQKDRHKEYQVSKGL